MVILLYFYKCWISVNFDIQFIYIWLIYSRW
jgi:hypothetical protein